MPVLAPHELTPLHHLPAGQRAEIVELVGQREQIHRLKELGLRQGMRIEMLQPGKPCVLRLLGQRLCFRGADLMHVLVRPLLDE